MKVRFLINPSADKGRTSKRWPEFFEGKGLDYRVCEELGMIERFTKQAVKEGVERVVIVGGDGSLNTAVNALGGADLQIGVIPSGAGNDFAHTAGVKFAPPERYLDPCNLRRIDLGKVDDRLFANIFGSGFDADAARERQLSGIKGDLGYLVAVLRTLRVFESPRVAVETDRERLELEVMTVSVGNGRYHGGMFMLTPTADLADGELDLCLVRKISKLRFLRLIPTSFKGKHVEVTDVVSMHRFRRMKLSYSRPVHYHIDGEVSPHAVSELEICILPRALTFVVP